MLPFEKPTQTQEQTIPGALAKLGLKPERHRLRGQLALSFDHCGGNKHFTARLHGLPRAGIREVKSTGSPSSISAISDLTSLAEARANRRQAGAAGPGSACHAEIRASEVSGDQEIAKGVWLSRRPATPRVTSRCWSSSKGAGQCCSRATPAYSKEGSRHEMHFLLPPRPCGEPEINQAVEGDRGQARCRDLSIPRSGEFAQLRQAPGYYA